MINLEAIGTQKMEFLGFIISFNDVQASPGQGEGHKAEVQMCTSRSEVNNTRAGPPHWHLGSNKVGGNTSTIALSQSSGTEDPRASPSPLI